MSQPRTLHSILTPLPAFSVLALPAAAKPQATISSDLLPSWNDRAAKHAIVSFVVTVTLEGSPDFVPPTERIATFDDDGTLWVAHPM